MEGDIVCPYKDKCISYGTEKCYRCRHNRGKRDYFDPVRDWEPYVPPWKRYTYCGCIR